MTAVGALDLWETGLMMTPAARAVLLLQAAGHADVTDWPVGRRDGALLSTYCSSHGPLAAVTECPACGASLDVTLDPHRLTEPPATELVMRVEHDGYRVVARAPTTGDLAQLSAHAPLMDLRADLLERCVVEAEHHDVAISPRALPEAAVVAVETALEEADPGAELTLALSCADCRAEWTEILDPVWFAWSSIEASARMLATDVHTLAHAYGWREQEILELSPFRRHLYLSAVQP